jgi:hypothetical protein
MMHVNTYLGCVVTVQEYQQLCKQQQQQQQQQRILARSLKQVCNLPTHRAQKAVTASHRTPNEASSATAAAAAAICSRYTA